mmetsp:Transcript_17358/g.36045  ORF Transcript_17358/g.36045 Transcript_17358/m.36045 type:complete len:119 (-) Transcript_17358:671-1027(-)
MFQLQGSANILRETRAIESFRAELRKFRWFLIHSTFLNFKTDVVSGLKNFNVFPNTWLLIHVLDEKKKTARLMDDCIWECSQGFGSITPLICHLISFAGVPWKYVSTRIENLHAHVGH